MRTNITQYPIFYENPLTDTDSYKFSHWLQYPPGVSSMYSYFESRGGRYPYTVVVGMQLFLLRYLLAPITKQDVIMGETFALMHGEPFNREGWDYLVEKYNGRFPVRIRAVPEGTIVPTHNLLFDIELTTPDPKIFWVVSWIETMMVRLWYPTSVATLSHYCKGHILNALQESSDDPLGELPFKLHDFGARGAAVREAAEIGGCAHLVNFLGSDTIRGIEFANHYYGCKSGMAGYSIPAAEHSTITMWGRNREADAYQNIVQRYLYDRVVPPGVPKLAACVSDSWDIYNAVENIWCGSLHDMVKNSGGKLVIRPDSGDPVTVLLKCLRIIERKLGMTVNKKGFKVMPPYFGLIQGDGINDESIPEILTAVLKAGFSASNLGFGMGGGLLQLVNRDTQKFAFKCASALFVDGKWIEVKKDPITDPGKRSKAGRLALIREGGTFKTVQGPHPDDVLETVYKNGSVLVTYTLDEVRERANQQQGGMPWAVEATAGISTKIGNEPGKAQEQAPSLTATT
jgi:nicotinamide phosphoribosyltransferase